MRVLYLHADYIKYRPVKKAVEYADEPEENEVKECLVCFVTVEKGDEKDKEKIVEAFLENLREVSSRLNVRRIVIYPYSHLSSELANPLDAKDILEKICKRCSVEFECYKAPFGWYKEFEIKVKGHPLAEASRVIKVEEEIRRVVEKEYYIIYKDRVGRVEEFDLEEFNEEFRILVEKEALGKELEGGEPVLLEIMKRLGFEWEEMSDYGHMRYGPKASLLMDLITEYSKKVCLEFGRENNIPIFIVKGTNMFNLDEKPIKEHADLFGERLYEIETDKGRMVLRYAACFQQFAMAKDWTISYKEIPFGMLEIADSYRFEQRGEVDLTFRMRKFLMPDMHVFCRDEEQAKEFLLKINDKIMKEMEEKLGERYEILVNVSSPQQFERYKDYLIGLSKRVDRPILICVYKGNSNYYWTLNIEYHIIDYLKRPREIGTVQIDVGNSRRFGIVYYDENSQKRYPVILHTAILGSVERFVYTILNKSLRERKFPVWFSPTQVRIIPVSENYLEFAEKIAERIEREGFRVEIDDRNLTVSRKIRDSELDWVSYAIVVGEKEMKSGKLPVRIRGEGIKEMTLSELIERLKKETEGYPKLGIYWSKYLSRNPVFS